MKFLLLSFAIFFFSLAQAAKYEVRVSEKATVRVGTPIRLGHLISGQIEDQELSDKVYDLVVFEPIDSEADRVVHSEELALVLRRKLSFQDLQRLSVKIPEQFTIHAQRNFVYAGDIQHQIAQRAHEICADCSVEFDDLKVPQIKTRDEVLQTRLETQAMKTAGGFLIPYVVETSNGKGVYWVTGKVSFYRMAPVAKRMIRFNEPISQSDFEMKKVDVTYARDGVPSPEELAGKVAMRTLSAGQPIFSGDLKKELAAQRGQLVKIVIGGDSFEITTSGTAEESGSVGDLIKVKGLDTQKLLSGILIDKGTVKVQ